MITGCYLFQVRTYPAPCGCGLPRGTIQLQFQFPSSVRCRRDQHSRRRLAVRCKSSGPDDDFLLASLLVPETTAHYRMRRREQGFKDEEGFGWGPLPPSKPYPFRPLRKRRPGPLGIGADFLRRFKLPTVFLKVSCDGDFLLPIIVGEFAVEKLIGAMWGADNKDFPDQYQLVQNVVSELGYEVKMVRITERIVNAYVARLYFGKPESNEVLSVDVRPSDAINVANRCKAPIYVSKEIVVMDAISISYGTGRVRDQKPTYDVFLDSAVEGPDLLAEELHLVRSMNLAVKEERYGDAASWRDKLMEFLKSRNDV